MANKCPKCQFENPDDNAFCGKSAAPLMEEISVSHTKDVRNTQRIINNKGPFFQYLL
jgi:hypothetical protein